MQMRHNTMFRTTAATIVLMSTLAAAGGALAQAVPLRMTVWTGNKAHLDLFNGIAAEYKKAKPDVQVTF